MKGEDQVVDIDLDKDTVLKPPQLKYTPIEHRSHWHEAFHEATVEGPILPTPPLSTDGECHPLSRTSIADRDEYREIQRRACRLARAFSDDSQRLVQC